MATKGKKPTTGRLAEIVKYRREQGGSVTGSLVGGIKERLKEKFDPRQLINQKGLLTALFPGLKTYQSKTIASEISKPSMQIGSFEEIKPILETISFNTKITAKNTMVLPALHRDVNVIRQNMVKLVKIKGGDARTKADMYFVKAKEREEKYERELRKERTKQNKVEKLKEDEEKKSKSFLGKIFSAIIKGLELVVQSILKLGQAILGAFKFMATVVLNTISTIIKSLFNIASLLMPSLTDFFEEFFGKGKFLTKIISSIARLIIGSVYRMIFGRTFLGRLGFALVAIIASLLGIKYTQSSLYEQRLRQKPLSTEQEIAQIEKLEKYQTLPTEIEEGKPIIEGLDTLEGRKAYLESRKSRFSSLLGDYSSDIRNNYYEEVLNEFLESKRMPYQVLIPGLQSPYTGLAGLDLNAGQQFFLTKKEAMMWGKDQDMLKYLFQKLLDYEKKEKKSPEELSRMSEISEQIKILKQNMLLTTAQFINEQIKNSEVKQSYLNAINDTMKGDYLDSEDLIMRRAVNDAMENRFAKEEMGSIEKQIQDIKKTALSPLQNVKETIKSGLMGVPDQLNESLQSGRKEFIDPLIDKTYDNRRQSVVFKQPIVINQESQSKTSEPYGGLGTPASAWNNDFIDNHFLEMMYSPVNFFRN